jgi:hypothetical protein
LLLELFAAMRGKEEGPEELFAARRGEKEGLC